MRALGLITAALLATSTAHAQGVLVAPPSIVVDHRTRSGSMELYNPGATPVEVSVSTIYGYPVSDSIGRATIRFIETPDSTEPSAAEWITAYPKRLVLRPQERQTVRLLGRPPAGLADGEYWTRLVVAAKGAVQPADSGQEEASISVGLSVEVRTVVAVLYRKGAVRTGLATSAERAAVEGDSVVARVRLERQGNAAYVGTLRARLVDARGAAVATTSIPVAVYHTLEPRLAFATAGLAPGAYTVQLELTTEREDLSRNVVLPVAPIRLAAPVAVPGGTSGP